MIATWVLGVIFILFYSSYYLFMSWMSRKSQGIGREPDYHPKVSIIVPTYNEEATIEKKLSNLITQDYKGEIETIIVDSASLDRTIELAEKFCREKGLKVTMLKETERAGKAHALNCAFAHCSGDIVVMTDADAAWREHSLSQAISNLSDQKVGAVTGRQVLLNPRENTVTKTEATYRAVYETLRLGESVLDTTPIFHGEISCYRKLLLDRVSEDSMADDSELAVKMRKKGYRAICDPRAIFYEYAPVTFQARFTQKVRRGQGLIQLFLREWKVLFNAKYGKFGTIIFPAEFFMHIISPVLLLALIACVTYELIIFNFHIIIGIVAILLLAGLVLALSKINVVNFAISFLDCQFILLASLFYQLTGRRQYKWQKIEEIRDRWRGPIS